MRYKRLVIIFLTSVMMLSGATLVAAKPQPENQLEKYYEARIAEKIAKYQSKTELAKSRSKNLRLDAAIATEKATFLSLNKDILVKEMVEQNVGRKPYKIDVFLNQKFSDDNRRLSKKD